MGAADGLHSRFREAEVLYFAFLDQVFYRARYVFHGDVWIYAVLVEQIDYIGVEALERGFGYRLDVLGAAIDSLRGSCGGIELEAEFGSDCYLVAERSQSFAYEHFVGEGAVGFGSIEECYSALDCGANQGDAVVLVDCGAVAEA
jgi:hypothetical protein